MATQGDGKVGVRFANGRDLDECGWTFDENGVSLSYIDIWSVDSRAEALEIGVPASVLDIYEAAGNTYGKEAGSWSIESLGGKCWDLFEWLDNAELYRVHKCIIGEPIYQDLKDRLNAATDQLLAISPIYVGFQCKWILDDYFHVFLTFNNNNIIDGIKNIHYLFSVTFEDGCIQMVMVLADAIYVKEGMSYFDRQELFSERAEYCNPNFRPETIYDFIINCIKDTVSRWQVSSFIWKHHINYLSKNN